MWLLQKVIVVVAISVDILVDIDFVTCKACRHSISVGRIERTLSLYNKITITTKYIRLS